MGQVPVSLKLLTDAPVNWLSRWFWIWSTKGMTQVSQIVVFNCLGGCIGTMLLPPSHSPCCCLPVTLGWLGEVPTASGHPDGLCVYLPKHTESFFRYVIIHIFEAIKFPRLVRYWMLFDQLRLNYPRLLSLGLGTGSAH